VLRNGNCNRRTFGPAAIAIGEPRLTPHGLRPTAASLAIAAGGNVKVVQQMLGHATASMALDLYGHLFPDQLDDVADRLDVIGRAAADNSAHYLRTSFRGPYRGRRGGGKWGWARLGACRSLHDAVSLED
jgi:hypothetical protein